MMCGGFHEEKDADKDIQELVNQVKAAVEEELGQQFDVYNAVKYRSQVVAGTNYNIKVNVGGDNYLHLKVFKPLPHTAKPPELKTAEGGKTLADEL